MNRAQLKLYGNAVTLWLRRYDTAEIAEQLGLPEHTISRWVANFRDVSFEAAA